MSPLLACGHLIGESRRSSLSDILPEACSSGVWRDTASLRDDRLSHTLQEARQLSRTPHGAAAGPFEGAPRVSTTCEVRSGFGPADRLPPGLVAHLPAVGDPIVLPLTAWVPTTRSAVPARSEPVAAQWRRPRCAFQSSRPGMSCCARPPSWGACWQRARVRPVERARRQRLLAACHRLSRHVPAAPPAGALPARDAWSVSLRTMSSQRRSVWWVPPAAAVVVTSRVPSPTLMPSCKAAWPEQMGSLTTFPPSSCAAPSIPLALPAAARGAGEGQGGARHAADLAGTPAGRHRQVGGRAAAGGHPPAAPRAGGQAGQTERAAAGDARADRHVRKWAVAVQPGCTRCGPSQPSPAPCLHASVCLPAAGSMRGHAATHSDRPTAEPRPTSAHHKQRLSGGPAHIHPSCHDPVFFAGWSSWRRRAATATS